MQGSAATHVCIWKERDTQNVRQDMKNVSIGKTILIRGKYWNVIILKKLKISVCIPTFNQDSYVEKAIRSVLQQSISISEIIVSNDCSTDNTRQILDALSNEIPNLQCVHQNHNIGISKNVRACMELAKGDYIIRLDSDDLLRPEFAEKLSSELNRFPMAGYAHAAVQQIDQCGNPEKIRSLSRPSGFQDGDSALKNATKGFRVAANIIMYRRTALEKVHFSFPPINFAEDYYLVTSLSAAGFGNIYLNEVLSAYRVWAGSGNVRKKRKLEEISGMNNLISELLEPAFQSRDWSNKSIVRMRKSLAIRFCDCLGWNIYSRAEKEELKSALFHLCPSPMVKTAASLYLRRLGFILEINKFLQRKLKIMLKSLYQIYLNSSSTYQSIH
jgi:glycosyltransferase involved in cell wall biosynthesis